MRRFFTIAITVAASTTAQSQAARVEGRVVDSANAHPVNAAVVRLLSAGGVAATDFSRDDGRFTMMAPPGIYRVVVARVGFGMWSRDSIVVPATGLTLGDVLLPPGPTQLDRVVVTASRKPERTLDAPATIFTVSPQETVGRSTATHVDQLRAVPGLDVAAGGIIQSNVVARGFNALFSGDLMMLVDNRFSFVPSLRVNVPSLIAPSREDVERIEVLLGPGAALYGPNAASGVMHIVTKSPFESRGTTIAVDGGERDFLRADSGTRP